MTVGVSVRHNFETAHRLPHLGPDSKCFNLHGHSWWAEVVVTADSADHRGMVVEFGAFKKLVREFIDHYFDHGAILGVEDPLLPLLRGEGCKAYQLDEWPTVEAVAGELFTVARRILLTIPERAPTARVLRVVVTETATNSAMVGEW
jgi:6-pyruvoyltetrahydropterin/6-carboxytetrahydropterin synthase